MRIVSQQFFILVAISHMWMCLQTTLQEMLSHKRVVEAVKEKARALMGAAEAATGEAQLEEARDAAAKVASRYERLVDAWLVAITQLEEALDTLTHFSDVHKALVEYQHSLWERLSSYKGKVTWKVTFDLLCVYLSSQAKQSDSGKRHKTLQLRWFQRCVLVKFIKKIKKPFKKSQSLGNYHVWE